MSETDTIFPDNAASQPTTIDPVGSGEVNDFERITFRYLLQPIGHFQYISPAVISLTGYSPGDFYQSPNLWIQCVHPEDQPNQNRVLQGIIEPRNKRFRLFSPGKGYISFEQDVNITRDDEGRPLAIESECRLMDEERTAHIKGDLSEPGILNSLDMSPTPLTISSIKNHRILFASKSFVDFLNYPLEELRRYEADRLPFWLSLEEKRHYYHEFLSEHRTEPLHVRLRAADGSIKHGLVSYQIVTFQGEPCNLIQVSDITAIGEKLDRLETERDSFVRLVEHSPLSINMCDMNGKTLIWNRKSEEVFGWSAEEVVGKTMPCIVDYGEEAFINYLKDLAGQNSWTGTDVNLRKKDGSEITLCMHTSPVYDQEGLMIGALGILSNPTDLSQARMLQKALYTISGATCEFQNLNDLYHSIHQALHGLMPAENFYIALYDRDQDLIHYPYFVDEVEKDPQPAKGERGVTAYVIRTGDALLADPVKFRELVEKGEIEEVGAPSIDWLGVPLKTKGHTFGVIAVQTYTEGVRYTEDHKNLLEFVSDQIAMAVERTRNEETILISEKRYRDIVEDQTDLICRFRLDGGLTFGNQAFCNFFDIEPDAIQGHSVQGIFTKTQMNRIARHVLKKKVRQAALLFDAEHVLKDHSLNWMEWKVRAIHSDNGELREVQAVGRDITEHQMHHREMELITKITNATRFTHSTHDMLNEILDQINASVRLDALGFSLCAAKADSLAMDYVRGLWKNNTHQVIPIDHTTIGEIFRTRGIYLNNRLADKPVDLQNEFLANLKSLAGIPLVAEDTQIGMLWLGKAVPITDEEISLIKSVGDITANGLHRINLLEKTQERLRRLTTLKTIDLAITSTVDLRVILDILIEQIVSQLNVDAASIWLYDPTTQLLEYRAGSGFQSSSFKNYRLRMGESHAGMVALERQREFVQNLDGVKDSMTEFYKKLGEQFASFIAIPLIAKGQVKGVLEVFTKRRLNPDEEWLEFLDSLGGQAAIALDNASMFEHLQRSNIELSMAYDATIDGWARALEMRDQETIGHTRRVADLTIGLVKLLNDDRLNIEQVRRGVMLHDIGKMGIPDRILLKKGRLTQDEWKIMRMHPAYAYDMLHSVPNLRKLVDIPYCHHEQWDGGGYPRGLKAEEIPLSARIFTIVDVWDAIRSDRPYRPAWPEQRAVDHIRTQSGKQFSPQLVELFLDNLGSLIRPETGYPAV